MSCVCYTSSLINHSDWVLCRGEEREPGTHCSLLCYLKISGNFCLPTERPKCRIILPVKRFSWVVLKSETISLTVCIASFKTVPRERFRQSRALASLVWGSLRLAPIMTNRRKSGPAKTGPARRAPTPMHRFIAEPSKLVKNFS